MVLPSRRIVSFTVIGRERPMSLLAVLECSALYVSSTDSSPPFQWSSINELDKLPSLQVLECRNNPLMDTEKNPETLRQLIIAKISQLEVLNKSQVCDASRNCTAFKTDFKLLLD